MNKKTTTPKENIFAAMVSSDQKEEEINIYLVNMQKDIEYEKVVVLSRGFTHVDDELIETSCSLNDAGKLNHMSSILIDTTDVYELDFTIWYMIDIYEKAEDEPHRLTFSLPRLKWFDKKNHGTLPLLKATGCQIELLDDGVPEKRVEIIAKEK